VTDEEYKQEYDKAAAELEAAAQATTARGPDGKFAKVEKPAETPAPEVKPEPAKEAAKEPEKEPAKAEDPLAELRARVEKAEKMARDNQAYATRMAQEAAQLRKEREQREREAKKPAILDANPELADAIRFVAGDPAPKQQQEAQATAWQEAIERVHPGIFTLPNEDELVQAVLKRQESGENFGDPLVAIKVITEEKLAQAERQIGKRFAAEAAKLAQKSAMSVPGAGAGSVVDKTPIDAQLAEVQRIQKMSDAEFQREVRRVKGL
jgi:hypothetical protein